MHYEALPIFIMLVIREIKVKSILVKSNLPEIDFVINPYVGCQHACIYCYARFMKRFTSREEPWGKFVDVKINAPDLIPKKGKKFKNKSIAIGSVCDPYQPIERKYKLTRIILEKLIPLQPNLYLMTKSDLVVRDINLFKKFRNCIIAISLSILNEKLRIQLEPFSSQAKARIDALKKLHNAGISTVLFISPIFPYLTNWKKIIEKTKNFADEFWFENLNLYPSIKDKIYRFLKKNKLELMEKYREIYSIKSDYWNIEEKRIKEFCRENEINYKIYFHHRAK